MIGFQTRDFMTIRYMKGPGERMERYAYIQTKYKTHIDTEDNSPKCMMKQGRKTCDMIAKSRGKKKSGKQAQKHR